jgi:predicted small secreted protein
MKAIFTSALVAWLLVLGGCNTMEGLGKDIQQLGQKIEKKAQ